ncbi:hypothetical protein H4R33_002050 [Dimargaris cristalligena]|nr:hypothetical protein H4R33_002050 [Dimargaris cristalligena]
MLPATRVEPSIKANPDDDDDDGTPPQHCVTYPCTFDGGPTSLEPPNANSQPVRTPVRESLNQSTGAPQRGVAQYCGFVTMAGQSHLRNARVRRSGDHLPTPGDDGYYQHHHHHHPPGSSGYDTTTESGAPPSEFPSQFMAERNRPFHLSMGWGDPASTRASSLTPTGGGPEPANSSSNSHRGVWSHSSGDDDSGHSKDRPGYSNDRNARSKPLSTATSSSAEDDPTKYPPSERTSSGRRGFFDDTMTGPSSSRSGNGNGSGVSGAVGQSTPDSEQDTSHYFNAAIFSGPPEERRTSEEWEPDEGVYTADRPARRPMRRHPNYRPLAERDPSTYGTIKGMDQILTIIPWTDIDIGDGVFIYVPSIEALIAGEVIDIDVEANMLTLFASMALDYHTFPLHDALAVERIQLSTTWVKPDY